MDDWKEYREIIEDGGIDDPVILAIRGKPDCEDIIFRSNDKFGCYEGVSGDYVYLGEGLSEKDVWEVYGEGGRNVPFLKDWFYEEIERALAETEDTLYRN